MKTFWVVGESSGDHHAAALLRALQERAPDWEHAGMGGAAMERAGCEIVANLSEAALMGLAEVLRHLPRLLRLRDRLIEEVERRGVELLVLVDFPDFNLHLARRLRKRLGDRITIFYYVSPQVWAWRRRRAGRIARLVDEMAVLFPFEVDVYRKHGLEARFFGHPLAGEVKPSAPVEQLRRDFLLGEGEEAVALLPGSRRQEVERLLPVQLEALAQLRRVKGESVVGLVAVADTVDSALLHELAGSMEKLQFVEGRTHDALSVARVALVKSGTSTLEATLIGTPFVVLYKVAPLTYRLARLLVRGVKHIAMVNVLAGREVVRERIQDEASGETLARDLLQIWEGAAREQAERELAEVADRLGEPGQADRLAEWMVERFAGERP